MFVKVNDKRIDDYLMLRLNVDSIAAYYIVPGKSAAEVIIEFSGGHRISVRAADKLPIRQIIDALDGLVGKPKDLFGGTLSTRRKSVAKKTAVKSKPAAKKHVAGSKKERGGFL